MLLRHHSMGTLASSTITVPDVAGLGAIHERHVSAVVLPRHGQPALASYLERVSRMRAGPLCVTVRFAGEEEGAEGLERFAALLPPDDARDALVEEVALWAEVVATLTGCPQVAVHLGCARADHARAFRAVASGVRLVTSLAHPAVEWIEEDERQRRMPCCEHLLAFTGEGSRRPTVRSCAAGDVVLLKGNGWSPDDGARGVLHRAPEIAREARHGLVLDVVPFGRRSSPVS